MVSHAKSHSCLLRHRLTDVLTSAFVPPGCLGDTKGTLELAQMGEMSAEIYQRSRKNCGRKILVPCLFRPYLPLQLEMLQRGAILGVSHLHNVSQLSPVLALPSVEGCVRTRVHHAYI